MSRPDQYVSPICPPVEQVLKITLVAPHLEAVIHKKGYVSGFAAETLKDVKTGFRDSGFGLDIVDWIMEPGSDEAYRDRLNSELIYRFNNPYHGKTAKRSIEGPQICTQAKEVSPEVVRGTDQVPFRTPRYIADDDQVAL
jgi:hypothetical protein